MVRPGSSSQLTSAAAALALVVLLPGGASPAFAQADPSREPADPAGSRPAEPELEELQRQIDVLAEEVERLRAGETPDEALSEERRRALGLAPSASATYARTTQGVSLAGYGEMLLQNYASENQAGAGNAPVTRLDFLRAILYAGYRFNDRFLFNSEIEVEHAGEIFVEFAYLDYLINEHLSLRGGMLLLPMGLVNEFHEPTVFLGAVRPQTEQRILPSTWRENGAGLLGSYGPVSYRAYVVNGLNAAGFSSVGLRGGRQKGIQARAAHLAFAGRADVTLTPGIFVGGSMYRGGSGQDQIVDDDRRHDVTNTIGELHGQAQLRGFDLRALYAVAVIDDAAALSRALELPTEAPVAERMHGGYVQVGYDILSQTNVDLSLMPYVRYEHVDTQARVPNGFQRDRSRDGSFTSFGLEVKPIPNIVLKTEYQWIRNEAGTGRDQFNINLGYAF